MTILFAVLGLLGLVLVAVHSRFCRAKLLELRERERRAADFFAASKPLVEDPDTPDEMLEMLEFMNANVTDKDGARKLFFLLQSGRMTPYRKRDGRMAAAINQFLARRPELDGPYGDAIVSSTMAMTFNSSWFGPRVRLALAGIDTPKRQEEVMALFRDTDRKAVEEGLCQAA